MNKIISPYVQVHTIPKIKLNVYISTIIENEDIAVQQLET